MIPEKIASDHLPSPALNQWSSLLPSDATSTKMIALCEWIKALSQPLGFGAASSMAKNVQTTLTAVRFIKQAKSGELSTALNPDSVASVDLNVRSKFWRTLSLSCMLASEGSRIFSEPDSSNLDTLFNVQSTMIGHLRVSGMDLSKVESFKLSLDDLLNNPNLANEEKLAKITDIALFSLSVLKDLVPKDQMTSKIILGGITATLGVIKAFSTDIATLAPQDQFEKLSKQISKKLNLELVKIKKDVELKFKNSQSFSYDINFRGNLEQNLAKLKTCQNEIELYLHYSELIEDLIHFENAFLDGNEESVSASQIDKFFELQKVCANGVISKIETTNFELSSFKTRLEILLEGCKILRESRVQTGEANIEKIIGFLADDIDKIDALLGLTKDVKLFGQRAVLSIGAYDQTLLTKQLNLKNAAGAEVNLQKWLSDAQGIIDPRYEDSIEATIAALGIV